MLLQAHSSSRPEQAHFSRHWQGRIGRGCSHVSLRQASIEDALRLAPNGAELGSRDVKILGDVPRALAIGQTAAPTVASRASRPRTCPTNTYQWQADGS